MGIESVQSRIVQIEATIVSLSARPAWAPGAAAGAGAGAGAVIGSPAAGAGLSTAAGPAGSWASPGAAAGGVLGGTGGFSAALDQALGQAAGLGQAGTVAGAGTVTASTLTASGVSAAPISPTVQASSSTPSTTPETGASGTGGAAGVGTSGADATGSTAGSGSTTGSDFGDRIVQSARQHLGVRYVWGGNSPSQGFDCSGLVKYVLRELGVSMPRVARDQAKMGTEIASLAQARPGDLLGMRNGTHIAVYLGDNKILHAPQPGERVSIRSLHSGDDIDTIRRVAPAGGSAAAGSSTRAAFERLVGAGA